MAPLNHALFTLFVAACMLIYLVVITLLTLVIAVTVLSQEAWQAISLKVELGGRHPPA